MDQRATTVGEWMDQAVKKLDPPTPYRLAMELKLKNKSAVYQWKNGRKRPSTANLLKIIEIAQRGSSTLAVLLTLLGGLLLTHLVVHYGNQIIQINHDSNIHYTK